MTASNLQEIIKQLQYLSGAERNELIRRLTVAPTAPQPILGAAQNWFWQRTEAARSTEHKIPRLRQWFIFMLIRYGGLRLSEILSLTGPALDFAGSRLKVPGKGKIREVPLSAPINRQLRNVWDIWRNRLGSSPFQCDPSLIRRNLGACARACGVAPAVLNVHALRRARERELEQLGLAPELIDLYMGRTARLAPPDHGKGNALLRQAIYREGCVPNSARNMFYGAIISLREAGLLVEIGLETESGLRLTSLITRTSRERLRLEEGSIAHAMIKAPWIQIGLPGTLAPCLPGGCPVADNIYGGIIESVEDDGAIMEIAVTLPGGYTLCSLTPVSDALQKGQEVEAAFSPLAVILTLPGEMIR